MKKIALLIVLIVGLTSFGQAQERMSYEDEVEPSAAQKKFAEQYVEAINSGDINKIKALVHGGSLAAINEENQSFFDYLFNKDLKNQIPDNYQISTRVVKDEDALIMEGDLIYPVRPTDEILLTFPTGEDNSTKSLDRYLYCTEESCLTVISVPSATLLAEFIKNIPAGK